MCESQKGLKHQSSQRNASPLHHIINNLRNEKLTTSESNHVFAARYSLISIVLQVAGTNWIVTKCLLHVFYLALRTPVCRAKKYRLWSALVRLRRKDAGQLATIHMACLPYYNV